MARQRPMQKVADLAQAREAMQDSVIPLGCLADLRLVWPGTAPSLATAPTMAIWLDIPNLVPEAAGSGLIQAVQQGTKKSPGTSSFLLGNPPPPPLHQVGTWTFCASDWRRPWGKELCNPRSFNPI